MCFLNNSAKNRIDQSWIVGAVVDLHGVMIHFNAAVRANQLRFIHRVHGSDSRAVL